MGSAIKSLKGVSNKEILTVFNRSFSDYIIPFKLTEEQLKAKMLADKTDLNFSVGAFEDRELVGFILHGFDEVKSEKILYNGGTGVIPEKRGSGLTNRMYVYALPRFKKIGINRLVLEVIKGNFPAIKSYEKVGFKSGRGLLCFKGVVKPFKTNHDVKIEKIHVYNWQKMTSFWDFQPTWQNSNTVIGQSNSNIISLGAYFEDSLVGYVSYNHPSKRIHQIAVDKSFRRKGIGTALLSEMAKLHGTAFSIINVDNSSKSTLAFLQKVGFEETIEQIEMNMWLEKGKV